VLAIAVLRGLWIGMVREAFSVFDPSAWRFADETVGGILFFSLARTSAATA
jgi:hypothetical protein